MEDEILEYIILDTDMNIRIDKYIASKHLELSRSYIQKLIKDEKVEVMGKTVKSNYKVVKDDKVSICIPKAIELNVAPENIPLDILYEDKDIIVINKAKGMVVHPAAGHYTGTVVNALLYHCKDQLSGINGVLRPGIVHRIDMNTTGAFVVCKNDKAHASIAAQLKEHTITRKYNAIVYNGFKEDSGIVDSPIGRHPVYRKKMGINYKQGKHAITHYKVLDELNGKFTYIECVLETGRTHQIRVHMASIHHPLLGDNIYGPEKSAFSTQGQTLHARVLGFIHPTTGNYMEFEAPLPSYFNELLTKLMCN
jgi:23S rRNA pseudouridine1911/1915/1917 synthase